MLLYFFISLAIDFCFSFHLCEDKTNLRKVTKTTKHFFLINIL